MRSVLIASRLMPVFRDSLSEYEIAGMESEMTAPCGTSKIRDAAFRAISIKHVGCSP
jgi:hypothetical protein